MHLMIQETLESLNAELKKNTMNTKEYLNCTMQLFYYI